MTPWTGARWRHGLPASRGRNRLGRPVPSTAWKPGQSGNPAGRPPTALLEAARNLTKEALERLTELMRQDDDRALALNAATEILNRGWGKPAQALAIAAEITTNVGGIDRPPVITKTAAEWLERRRAELAALESDDKPKH